MMVWRVGEVTITRIVEMEGPSPGLLADATPEAVREMPWLLPHFADDRGRLKASVNCLVVETPSRRIVVDTCVGNDKARAREAFNRLKGPFLEVMAGAGFAPESVDVVLCTHLHIDHVGWNTRLVDGVWVPTFPNARYLFARREYEFWRDETGNAEQREVFADSVRPVWDAGLADLVESDHRICPEVRLEPTAGHTPGHVSVHVESGGERALITGDTFHHPCQMARPHWGHWADEDPEAARATRRRMLRGLADSDVLVIGTHFHTPAAGHVRRDGPGYRFAVAETPAG